MSFSKVIEEEDNVWESKMTCHVLVSTGSGLGHKFSNSLATLSSLHHIASS